MLPDRLVCGVHDIRIQRRLLAEPKLTLKRALDLALAIEAVDEDASEIQKGNLSKGILRSTKSISKWKRVAKLIVIAVAVITIPKAVILRMRNAMLLES